MTGAFLKKAVINELAGREILGTLGKMEAFRECSSLDGMTSVYRIYKDGKLNYYLVDFSAEPYIKPMMDGEWRLAQVITSEFCFFSDK